MGGGAVPLNLIWPYPQKSSRTLQHNLRIKFGISEGRPKKFLEVGWPYPQRSSRPLQYDLRIELSMSDWQRQKSFAVDWHPKSSSNCGDDVEIWMWIEGLTGLLECFYGSRIWSAEYIDMRIARMSLCRQAVQWRVAVNHCE